MMSPLEEFRQHLAHAGRRLTKDREIVAAAVFSLRSPFTPDAVLVAIGKATRVNRATVYRTPSMLTDSGQVHIKSQSRPELVYSHSCQSPMALADLSQLCETKHASLIAGMCPQGNRMLASLLRPDFCVNKVPDKGQFEIALFLLPGRSHGCYEERIL